MSDLDELLDWIEGDDYGPPIGIVQAARTELAALRRRAEDAEMLLRKIGPIGWWMNYDNGELWSPNELLPYGIHIDPTGLPILTDEAREALK